MFYTIQKRGIITIRGVDLPVWRNVETFSDKSLAYKECALLQSSCSVENIYQVIKHLTLTPA